MKRDVHAVASQYKNFFVPSDVSLEESHKFIFDMDLSKISKKLSEQKGWSKCSAERACDLYRKFLFLQKKYGENYILSPSEDIDEVWHLHILDTPKYWQDCQQIFGKYFHHVPVYEKNKSEFSSFQSTQDLYYKEYNDFIYEVRIRIFSRILEFILVPFKLMLNGKFFRFQLRGEV